MNTPTKITFSRIIATILLLIALFVLWIIKTTSGLNEIYVGNTDIYLIYLIIFVFFVLASYTDHLDGKLARKNNQITDLGKFLDPVADKLLINSLMIFLSIPGVLYEGQMTFSFWCAILLIIRDITIDSLRFIAAQKNVVIAANIFGKLKTVLEMVAIGMVLLNGWPFNYFCGTLIAEIFVYLATAASIVSGIIYIVQNKAVLKFNEVKNDK